MRRIEPSEWYPLRVRPNYYTNSTWTVKAIRMARPTIIAATISLLVDTPLT